MDGYLRGGGGNIRIADATGYVDTVKQDAIAFTLRLERDAGIRGEVQEDSFVVEAKVVIDGLEGERAVHGAGLKVKKAETPREERGKGTLAGTCGAVDRDDGMLSRRGSACGHAYSSEDLGGRGNVVFFSMPGQPNLDDRMRGFKDVFATHPDIHIIDVVDIKGDSRNAFDNTQQYLSQTGVARVSAFVCLEASSGKVVADAVRRQKVTDRTVVAWDVEQDTLAEIKDGTIEATISQKPFTMAFVGLKELDEIYHNMPKSLTKDYSVDAFSEYPYFIDTGTALVDKANVDIYAKAAAQH